MIPFRHLSHDEVIRLHATLIDAGLAPRIGDLLGGLPHGYIARLPASGPFAARLLSILHEMNGTARLAGGAVPLVSLLQNAEALLDEESVARAALSSMRQGLIQRAASSKAGGTGSTTDGRASNDAVGESWPSSDAVRVFIIYDPAEESARTRLSTHLSTMVRNGMIAARHSGDIEAGIDHVAAIDKYLARAEIVLLLVSPSFTNSETCAEQLKRALDHQAANNTRIIPVLVKRADIQGTPYERFNPLPAGGKEVSAWSNADDAWYDVTVGIRRVVEGMRGKR